MTRAKKEKDGVEYGCQLGRLLRPSAPPSAGWKDADELGRLHSPQRLQSFFFFNLEV